MKAMFPILKEVSDRMLQYATEKSFNGSLTMEAREICIRYTLDNVAACAFGLEGSCFQEDYPMFRKLADDFLSPGTLQSIKQHIIVVLPSLNKFLKVK